MIITNGKYSEDLEGNNNGINATIDNILMNVPINLANRHYAEILKQVADGDITIAEAD